MIKNNIWSINSLFFLCFLYIVSCSNSTKPNLKDKYILFEIQRTTGGVVIEDSAGWFSICCKGFKYESETKNLRVYRILSPSFKDTINFDVNSDYKIICAIDRQLNQDLGMGNSGGIIPIYNSPQIVKIMSFPISMVMDSIKIIDTNQKGIIKIEFDSTEIKIAPDSQWIWTQKKQVETIVGKFFINDEIIFTNHGYLSKRNIIF